MRWMLVCLLAFASVAHADGKLSVSADGKRITLPNNVVLEAKGGLWATRGKLTVGIEPTGGGRGVHGITGATLDHGTVAISYTDLCGAATYTMKLTLDAIDARFANVAALALHKAKRFVEAEAGFAKAHSLDPSWKLPLYNLASAQNLDGHPNDALVTLAPLVAVDPIATYVQVRSDPELASLLSTPAFTAVRSPKVGTATAATPIAFSISKQLVAARVVEACGYSDSAFDYIAVRSVDGKTSLDLPLGDCKQASASQRADADHILAELGFDPVPDADRESNESTKVSFPKFHLGLVTGGRTGDGHVRVVRGNTVLVERETLGPFVAWAAMLPTQKLMVYSWWRDQPEAECGSPPPYTGLGVLALP